MKKKNALLWSIGRIRNRIPAILVLTLSCVVNAVLGVMFSLGSKGVIDAAELGAKTGDHTQFWIACAVQGGIILGILLTMVLNRHLKDKLLMDLDRDWKKKLLHGLLHGDYAGVSAYHSGELLNRMNNDVRILCSSLLTIVPSVASMVTKLVSAVAVLVIIEPLFTLVVVVAGIVVILVTSVIRRNLKGINKRVSEEEGKVSGFLQETMEKLLMVQAMDVSAEMEKRADKLLQNRHTIMRKRKNISLISNTGVSVMFYAAGFAALIFCANGLLNQSMSFGTLTAVTQLVAQVRAPFANMSGIIPQYVAMTAAAERLMELEEVCSQEPVEQLDGQQLYQEMETIGAQDLCFAYDRDTVFDHTSFSLPKGQFGVILGHSGIGKSTLLKLMLGMFRTDGGQLYVHTAQGRVPLDRSTRRLFAYVPQGNLLISGTLRDNLLLTCPNATQEQIDQAVHISAMDDFLPSLPKGLDTVIGESAAGLSEGQAQRLSIARAILSGAPVLLLDEATSALDADTEQLVLKRLSSLPGKTCIAVTHRPAAIALSDWTMEMKDGQCLVRSTQT